MRQRTNSARTRQIGLLRNTYLAAYLQVLREHNVDPEPLLKAQGLPKDFEIFPELMHSAHLLHRFIEDAAGCAPPGTISTAAGLYNAAQQPNPFSDVACRSITLLDAIHQHNGNVAGYSPVNRFKIELSASAGRWLKLGLSPSPETELFCAANLLGHVRTILGTSWQPDAVEVSVVKPAVLRPLPLYQGVNVTEIARSTVIHIPAEQLATSIRRRTNASPEPEAKIHSETEDLDFLRSLRLVMRSYVRVGSVSIDAAAAAAGLTRRTLQRRLEACDLTYSSLLDQVRFDVARSMLVKSAKMDVTQIGYELGYQDPGSFSRAFRRFAGTTPRAFRRHYLAEAPPSS